MRIFLILGIVLLAMEAAKPAAAPRYELAIRMAQTSHAVVDVSMTREVIDYIAGSGLPEVLASARAEPVFEYGHQIGYRLMDIVPGSVFDVLNLRDGDTLLEIEEVPLASDERARGMLKYVATQKVFTYTVRHKTGRVFDSVLYRVAVK